MRRIEEGQDMEEEKEEGDVKGRRGKNSPCWVSVALVCLEPSLLTR